VFDGAPEGMSGSFGEDTDAQGTLVRHLSAASQHNEQREDSDHSMLDEEAPLPVPGSLTLHDVFDVGHGPRSRRVG